MMLRPGLDHKILKEKCKAYDDMMQGISKVVVVS